MMIMMMMIMMMMMMKMMMVRPISNWEGIPDDDDV